MAKNSAGTSAAVNSRSDASTIDLAEIIYLLWQHIAEIIICALAGAIAVFLVTKLFIAPKYTATARMYIASKETENQQNNYTDVQLSTTLRSDYQELLTSRSILEDVEKDLDLSYTTSALKKMITVTNPTDTRILNVSVEDENAKEAADIANAVAKSGSEYLPSIVKSQEITTFEQAEVPQSPSSPNVSRDSVIGALIFALADIAVIVIKYLTNDKLITADDVQMYLGFRPLASVPEGHHDAKKKRGRK